MRYPFPHFHSPIPKSPLHNPFLAAPTAHTVQYSTPVKITQPPTPALLHHTIKKCKHNTALVNRSPGAHTLIPGHTAAECKIYVEHNTSQPRITHQPADPFQEKDRERQLRSMPTQTCAVPRPRRLKRRCRENHASSLHPWPASMSWVYPAKRWSDVSKTTRTRLICCMARKTTLTEAHRGTIFQSGSKQRVTVN